MKAVSQYTTTGLLISVYDTIMEACNNTGLKKQAISNNLRKRSKSSGGYVWKYVSKNSNIYQCR